MAGGGLPGRPHHPGAGGAVMSDSGSLLTDLAESLGVSVEALERLGFARDVAGWTCPERDADGAVIGTAVRSADGRKVMKRGSKRGLTLAWPLRGLDGSIANDPILVVEGASDTAAALDLGFAAVGRPSAMGGLKHLTALLRDRHVVIVGENDEAGRRGAEKIAQGLYEVCRSVRVIFPPEGTKDLRAWCRGGFVRDQVKAAIDGAEFFEPSTESSPPTDPAESEKVSQSEAIVRLALELYRIGRSEIDEPFAVRRDGLNVAMMFRGSRDALRATLAREYRRRHGGTPSASAIADALTTLQGEALDKPHEPVALRLAEHDGGIVIDLGDEAGRAVIVRPDKWKVDDQSPILFRRSALTAALPMPDLGGDLAGLRDVLNVTDETWPLVCGVLVAGLMPLIPHPILMLGACKDRPRVVLRERL